MQGKEPLETLKDMQDPGRSTGRDSRSVAHHVFTLFLSISEKVSPQFRPCPKGPAVVLFAQWVCGYNGTVRLAAANTPICKPRPSAEEALGANAWK